MPRKLLQINITANWGSTGRIVEDIGLVAMSHGWESYIAYGRKEAISASHLIRVGGDIDLCAHVLGTRVGDIHGLMSRRATGRLIEQIDAISPDIIHLHNLHGYYINYPMLFDYLASVSTPVVWTLHDCWAMTGRCAHFQNSGCRKWMSGCYGCENVDDYPRTWGIVDRSHRNFELKRNCFTSLGNRLTLVSVSQWLCDVVKHSFLADSKLHIIHNGVDTAVFAPQPISTVGSNSAVVVLGVASMWNSLKGLDDFCRLRALLDSRYRIVLAGLTPSQIKHLPDGIEGIPRIDSASQLAKLYSQATVYVNATRYDTLPTTNLEALACGTPVVTYRTGGAAETIAPGVGVAVTPGDIHALAAAVAEMCDAACAGREALAQQCRAQALEHFDSTRQFSKYFPLYTHLLQPSNMEKKII